MSNSKSWIKKFFLTSAVVMLFVSFVNIIVDPYGIFDIINIEGFNTNKSKITTDQIPRFYAAKRMSPDNMIFGTSRVGSINPRLISEYAGGKTYNFSIAGSHIFLQNCYINYFLDTYQLKTIILGLDFFSFIEFSDNILKHKQALERVKSRFYINDYLVSVVNIDTFLNSINTVKDNIRGRYKVTDYQIGMNIFEEYKEKIEADGLTYVNSSIERVIRDYNRDYYRLDNFSKESITQNLLYVKEIINKASKKGVNIKIYINPVYFLQYDLIVHNGLKDYYLQWKKELAKITSYYDFSGYNFISTNPIYWYDSSHFRENVGDLIIKTLFTGDIIENFGAYIDLTNVTSYNQYMFDKIKSEDLERLQEILNAKSY